MNPVYQSAFLKALGWSLIDNLWQMGVLWFLYVLITGNGKKFSSSFRYSLALIALFIGSAGFFVSILLNYQDPGREFSIFSNASFLINYMPLLSASYLIITSFYITRWVHQYAGTRNLLNELEPAGIDTTHLIQQLKYITSVSRQIQVWCSAKIYTPLTTGFLKPVILLPLAAFTQLSTRQIEALIVHEFFHIKRNDYLVHLLISFAEAFLFFNPFAKLLLKNINRERENCCDDEVIRLGYDRWEYAHSLYTLSKNSQQEFRFALAATGDEKHLLLARIKRLLKAGTTGSPIKKPLAIFFLCLFGAGSMTKTVNEFQKPVAAQKPAVNQNPWHPTKPEQKRMEDGLANKTMQSKDYAVSPERTPTEELPTIIIKRKIKPLASPAPPSPPAAITLTEDVPNEENHIFYISSNIKTIEFSMIESPISYAENPENSDPTHPFVPGSTFYFPDHELSVTINGKKTINL